ncbi:protein of unknown function [Ruminococcus flavefaciens]|uniref:DUF4178 domain-containing protein n=1 Tax=Ruminococcus flavefaciens TaxID=1265 RepID=A0A1H6J1D8_RUMFL|nr:DUF4178 domain-containing protein [Ruminococcus flavefaciens]SEH52664.1 protein of unknown function [Ruminococcus flavefaciens]
MVFKIGDVLNVDGYEYFIIGKITYKNTKDNMRWDEYRMKPVNGGSEKWLSIDDVYHEYSISQVKYGISEWGYDLVDSGTEVVVSRSGSVDVHFGDRAQFYEYEDSTEEKIISKEIWSDEVEMSEGYYLDEDEITFVRHDKKEAFKTRYLGSVITLTFIGILCLIMFGPYLASFFHKVPTIQKVLDDDYHLSYVTSITGNEDLKAKVYKTDSIFGIDKVTKWIIDAIEGEIEQIQPDTTEGSEAVGILTKKEYCLVYIAESGDVYVQVSGRKYAFKNDTAPYCSTSKVHDYYKLFYYSAGYDKDKDTYNNSSSPYDSYYGEPTVFSSNTYKVYSETVRQNSIRQSSVRTRRSSGGGLSSGK